MKRIDRPAVIAVEERQALIDDDTGEVLGYRTPSKPITELVNGERFIGFTVCVYHIPRPGADPVKDGPTETSEFSWERALELFGEDYMRRLHPEQFGE